jgi:hypothetical protein
MGGYPKRGKIRIREEEDVVDETLKTIFLRRK